MLKKRVKNILIILVITLSSKTFALDIWSKYSKLSELSSDFTYKKGLKNLGVTLLSKGNLKFKRPDSFEWNVTVPNKLSFIFKDNAVSFLEDGKVMKSADSAKLDPKMIVGLTHMKAWMTIDSKFIEENYTIKQIAENHFEFTPKSDMKLFNKISIETGDIYPIRKIQLTEASGDLIDIEFTKTKTIYAK